MNCVVCGESVTAQRLKVFERTKRDYVVHADKWEIRDVATCSGACGQIRRRDRMREVAREKKRSEQRVAGPAETGK